MTAVVSCEMHDMDRLVAEIVSALEDAGYVFMLVPETVDDPRKSVTHIITEIVASHLGPQEKR